MYKDKIEKEKINIPMNIQKRKNFLMTALKKLA